jgi:hypothetical protein
MALVVAATDIELSGMLNPVRRDARVGQRADRRSDLGEIHDELVALDAGGGLT